MWKKKKTIVQSIKELVTPTKVEEFKEEIDSIEDPIEDVIEDNFEEDYSESELFAEIPEILSADDKTRLEELNSYRYAKTEDLTIIFEREWLILLLRAIQIKKIVWDENIYAELDEAMMDLAVSYYLGYIQENTWLTEKNK